MELPSKFEGHKTCPLRGHEDIQDDYSDITVESRTWTKRFHRRVLAESVFFKTLFRQKGYLENQTGRVHIQIGDEDTLEQALMFLYGINPMLNVDNISLMLEMAEFLFIPALKLFCVKWLKKLTITKQNVWLILSLGSLYDFSIPSLDLYLHEHLTELMPQTEMLQIDKQSVDYLLSNPQLSYVEMDLKFDFLMRWTKYDSDKRMIFLKELLHHINLLQLSDSMIQKAKCDTDFKYNDLLPERSIRFVERFIAIVFKIKVKNVNTDLMIVFDEHSQEWHKVEANSSCALKCEYTRDVADDETIYHVLNDNNGTIECIKPECNTRVTTRLDYASSIEEKELSPGVTNKLCFSNGMCYQIKEKKTEVMKTFSPQGHLLEDVRTNLPLDLRPYSFKHKFISYCLYVGNTNNIQGITQMTPVLSTLEFDVIGISCWNNYVAMLSDEEDYLLIYNTTTCRLIEVNCDLRYNTNISSCYEGFLVITGQNVVCIMRSPEDDAFRSVSVDLFDEPFYEIFEIFNDARNIYIYKYDDNNDKFVLGIANIKETFTIPKKAIAWRYIPALDISINSIISIMSVKIPTANARCHFLCPCPQCKPISRGIKRKRYRQWSFGFWRDSENSNDEYYSTVDTSDDESD